jgi:hypothetical protein
MPSCFSMLFGKIVNLILFVFPDASFLLFGQWLCSPFEVLSLLFLSGWCSIPFSSLSSIYSLCWVLYLLWTFRMCFATVKMCCHWVSMLVTLFSDWSWYRSVGQADVECCSECLFFLGDSLCTKLNCSFLCHVFEHLEVVLLFSSNNDGQMKCLLPSMT